MLDRAQILGCILILMGISLLALLGQIWITTT
jgi:hypothetical protein